MMRFAKLFAASLILFLFLGDPTIAPARAAQDGPALVILTFEMTLKENDLRGELLADLVTEGLASRFPVAERKNLARILAEHELTLSGLVATDQAVQVGKLSGAQFVVAGRVFRLGDRAFVSVRLVSVETARFKGVSFSLPEESSVKELAARAVADLVKDLPRLQKELLAPVAEGKPLTQPPVPVGKPMMVAVLNFANQGQADSTWDWLGKGLADLTIGDLAGQDLKVVSREQMQELVYELQLTKKNQDPQAVARVLKAAKCVHGSYQVTNGRIELRASILDVSSNKLLHTATASGATEKVLDVQKQLAAELTAVLQGKRPETLDAAKLPRWTENLKATQLLYQGIEKFDKGEYLDAWEMFRRALRLDAQYADARYWSGRMMYYVQEYHQARVDLERFALENPRHGRVGDAMMEIINAAQLEARNAEEVLDVLSFAAQQAPMAEVANQFGVARSSTVGLYAAGLAVQILRSEGRFREAVDRLQEQIQRFPVNHPLYWIAWHEMLDLKVEHLKATGELLTIPAKPPPYDAKVNESLLRSSGGLHPGRNVTGGGVEHGNVQRGGDEPHMREFIVMTPKQNSRELDFRSDPLVPHGASYGHTYTRYIAADPHYYLTELEIEIRYRADDRVPYLALLEGDFRALQPLNKSGVTKWQVPLQPNTHGVAVRLTLVRGRYLGKVDSTPTAVTSWKITANLQPRKNPSGTLVLRPTAGLNFLVNLDGKDLPLVDGVRKIEDLSVGAHTVRFKPQGVGATPQGEIKVELAAGEEVEVALNAKLSSGLQKGVNGWKSQPISTPYEVFRLSARMGDSAGQRPGDVSFCRDNRDRWIVLWNLRRDLFMTISADRGQTWSPTVQLPLPVNSAHDEKHPVLMQDSDGRYVLAFASDRNQTRTHAIYACWSDDLVHFSAPVRVSPGPGSPLHLFRRADGTYLLYSRLLGNGKPRPAPGSQPHWAVFTSRDLVHWSDSQEILAQDKGYPKILAVVEDGGRYLALTYRIKPPDLPKQQPDLHMQTSEDGIAFSSPVLAVVPGQQVGGKSVMAALNPSDVVARRDGNNILAMAHNMQSRGVILAHAGGTNWPVLASPPAVDGRFWQGTFSFAENTLHFFSLPIQADSHTHVFTPMGQKSAEREWITTGQPLFLHRYVYGPQLSRSAPPEPPSEVTAHIIKRRTLPPRGNK